MSIGEAVARGVGEQLIKLAAIIFVAGASVAGIIIGAFWLVMK